MSYWWLIDELLQNAYSEKYAYQIKRANDQCQVILEVGGSDGLLGRITVKQCERKNE